MESNWLRPTLEINGVGGGYSGDGFKTVLPAEAVANLSCRLVPNQQPEQVANLISDFLKDNVAEGVDIKVSFLHGGEAVRTSPDSEVAKAALSAYEEIFDKPCKNILCGASIPIVAELTKHSGAEVVLIGYGLPEDLIHAPNENFDTERLAKGYATIIRMLEMLGE